MDSERTVKKLQEGKSDGERKTGRFRLRWMDNVELDMMNVCVKGCGTKAVDGTQWAPVVREAKV
jgi:hypothetical protein